MIIIIIIIIIIFIIIILFFLSTLPKENPWCMRIQVVDGVAMLAQYPNTNTSPILQMFNLVQPLQASMPSIIPTLNMTPKNKTLEESIFSASMSSFKGEITDFELQMACFGRTFFGEELFTSHTCSQGWPLSACSSKTV